MAKNTLVRAKIFKVNRRFHAGIDVQTCQLLQFFTKKILRIQKVRLGVSLCVQLTSLHYFLSF